ncbi:A/G-specific adenine glycosylase [Brevibacterium jeotgali]|uniref:Adenine DNA glycosylase n=1 Tax=Brevibacterium jeotgali TaxID=1262550 RepID=A0A2H1L0X7_9MICO|nr:A/G-specific adenine glycosylase [Brevibacterium jeotgali]TWC02091.1 A/G-specific DNA-adenine glycosylase [Brevibacterium jeotgali]SMY10558.1 A/G-specific DNA-adenine glycosylase [Brevibacterium jeotgali]
MTHRRTTQVTPASEGPGHTTRTSSPRDSADPSSLSAPRAVPSAAPGLPQVSEGRSAEVQRLVIDWFSRNARPLPWRDRDASAWSILVCEVMSQQTPVARVLPRWREWMRRWPTPADLAAAPASDVLIAWDSLGYPRRALRLQETAAAIADRHGNEVPHDEDRLLALPGVGAYTAAAVTSFAYGRRAVVLDVNVRRVLGRVFAAVEHRPASLTAAEKRWARALVPAQDHVEWNAGTMELGALVCTARNPDCARCPLLDACAWVAAGKPSDPTVVRRAQAWAGTDRQLRGAIMRTLRTAHAEDAAAVPTHLLTAATAALTADDAEALAAYPSPLRTAIGAVRDLDADGARTARLVDDLVRDGLAARDDRGIRLP